MGYLRIDFSITRGTDGSQGFLVYWRISLHGVKYNVFLTPHTVSFLNFTIVGLGSSVDYSINLCPEPMC